MLSKKKSSAISKFRFVLMLPVVFLLTAAFSVSYDNQASLQNRVIRTIAPVFEEVNYIIPILNPDGKIGSGFGMRFHPILKITRMHSGIDFRVPEGTDIIAAADGEVIVSQSSDRGYGNHVKLKHPDGTITLYAHLRDINVKKGSQIKQGEKIGTVGNTGLSLSAHLHFEVIQNGKKINPQDLIPELKK
ncbi:M23 family metallopeptidase [Chondrinema litorale]|uniref:M23 family metallopeptidase n=1 Tax=Chondrinema litorale TaxID=2994555 RepID=UPI0025438770|nr:M23 family metallopeptidase [Chondrinema litorale]UZR98777.1 M23 family metallopeptidase [Chondrinema litorale]